MAMKTPHSVVPYQPPPGTDSTPSAGADPLQPFDGGEECGVGLTLLVNEGKCIIVGVEPGSAAQLCGEIRLGDTILSIDGHNSLTDDSLYGPPGSKVLICLAEGGGKDKRYVSLPRGGPRCPKAYQQLTPPLETDSDGTDSPVPTPEEWQRSPTKPPAPPSPEKSPVPTLNLASISPTKPAAPAPGALEKKGSPPPGDQDDPQDAAPQSSSVRGAGGGGREQQPLGAGAADGKARTPRDSGRLMAPPGSPMDTDLDEASPRGGKGGLLQAKNNDLTPRSASLHSSGQRKLGLILYQNSFGRVIVEEVLEGAVKASGLILPGDQVLSIDNRELHKLTLTQVYREIQRPSTPRSDPEKIMVGLVRHRDGVRTCFWVQLPRPLMLDPNTSPMATSADAAERANPPPLEGGEGSRGGPQLELAISEESTPRGWGVGGFPMATLSEEGTPRGGGGLGAEPAPRIASPPSPGAHVVQSPVQLSPPAAVSPPPGARPHAGVGEEQVAARAGVLAQYEQQQQMQMQQQQQQPQQMQIQMQQQQQQQQHSPESGANSDRPLFSSDRRPPTEYSGAADSARSDRPLYSSERPLPTDYSASNGARSDRPLYSSERPLPTDYSASNSARSDRPLYSSDRVVYRGYSDGAATLSDYSQASSSARSSLYSPHGKNERSDDDAQLSALREAALRNSRGRALLATSSGSTGSTGGWEQHRVSQDMGRGGGVGGQSEMSAFAAAKWREEGGRFLARCLDAVRVGDALEARRLFDQSVAAYRQCRAGDVNDRLHEVHSKIRDMERSPPQPQAQGRRQDMRSSLSALPTTHDDPAARRQDMRSSLSSVTQMSYDSQSGAYRPRSQSPPSVVYRHEARAAPGYKGTYSYTPMLGSMPLGGGAFAPDSRGGHVGDLRGSFGSVGDTRGSYGSVTTDTRSSFGSVGDTRGSYGSSSGRRVTFDPYADPRGGRYYGGEGEVPLDPASLLRYSYPSGELAREPTGMYASGSSRDGGVMLSARNLL